MLIASAWPTKVGTRTQVAWTLIFGSRIFLVSTIIFHSSLGALSAMKSSMWGMTLKAMFLLNFLGSRSWFTKKLLVWFRSSSIASLPAPDVDWEVRTTTRLIFAASWIGFSATTIWMVEQLGLAMMPRRL